jgi:Abortive infection alpha
MDPDTIGKIADATKAVAETGGQAIEATSGFARIIKGPIEDLVGIVHDRVKVARWERRLALTDKAEAIMNARQLRGPTRALPLNFAVPLLTSAIFEEDDELQETWARMLVNAGDTSTEMELRTAYVEILRGMSAFDVKNLSGLAEATLALAPGAPHALGVMKVLHPELVAPGKAAPDLPQELAISLANLARLGCAMPGGGFGGSVLFSVMTVTQLGIALYKACS